MTSNRTLIRRNLVTSLQTIKAGQPVVVPLGGMGDFASTVARVRADSAVWTPTQVSAGDCPFIGILEGEEEKTFRPGGIIRCVWTAVLVLMVMGSSKLGCIEALDDLEDDVIAALSADTSRGGNAISTTFGHTQLDNLTEANQGILILPAIFAYERTVGITTG